MHLTKMLLIGVAFMPSAANAFTTVGDVTLDPFAQADCLNSDCDRGGEISFSTVDDWETLNFEYKVWTTEEIGSRRGGVLDIDFVNFSAGNSIINVGLDDINLSASVFAGDVGDWWFEPEVTRSNKLNVFSFSATYNAREYNAFPAALVDDGVWTTLSAGVVVEQYYYGGEEIDTINFQFSDRSMVSNVYAFGTPFPAAVPVPPAALLLSTALAGLFGSRRLMRG